MDFRQIKAIEKTNKEKWLRLDRDIPDSAGIYILHRTDDNGFRYAYVGQAKHILTRLAQHLTGYQHIDLSLKKHKLWSADNPFGWDVYDIEETENLDERERAWVKRMADAGFQLRNKTSGGQDEGKASIGEGKTPKGYYDGKKQGYKQCKEYVQEMFIKYLDFQEKVYSKITARKYKEFDKWLKEKDND